MICKYCKYEWNPRVDNPRECPRCKRVIWIQPEQPKAKGYMVKM